jgi:hypothetical protein
MTATALTTTSPVIFQTGGGVFKGKLRMYFGRFELTGTQLVFYKRSNLWMMFGLIGALIGARTAGKRDRDIELSSITAFARGKHGFNKKIVDFTFADGGTLRVTFDKFDEMFARLHELMAQRARLIDQGEQRWQVAAR